MMPAIEKMLEEVQGFVPHPVLLVSPEEAEAQSSIPEVWIQMLRRQSEGIKSWMEPWKDFQNLLPGVYDFLQHKVHGVCVLLEEGKPPSLLYVFSSGETDYYFYRGGPAVGNKAPDDTRDIWRRLPSTLQAFYSKVHNGWTSLSADSMGPLPVEDIELLSDWTGDMEPDELSRLPFRIDDVVIVFGNGGGDSLCLDLGLGAAAEDHALVYWHEDPFEPNLDQNFWALMDGWICGQLEDVNLAEQ
jgi:hypothetical protein